MKLVIASNNTHKISEIADMLSPLGYEVIAQRSAGIDIEPEENGLTFAENAAIKARAIYPLCGGCAVLADDSGLAVDYLGGAPGVFSHRYAGENATDADRVAKLLGELDGAEGEARSARFVCAMCFIGADGTEISVTGHCEGVIGTQPAGENGFGYDPVFCIADGRSFAQLSSEEKNSMSHRRNALEKLCAALEKSK